ncbi:hypothetical protein HF680_04415 [Brevundimonas sp. WCHBH090558]|uniref:hypothetical protein n=1 Tax=Brevundimonas huaxiensis TaxID=2725493 RepID=UPI0016246809|nr:hypothetical protein [Brevundimonas huaxiensis]MBC1181898.1 hypothetical protein [Brevundimonas huaxiensis]
MAAATLAASPALCQSPPTLDEFVTRANRIPLNATAMLRPDAHRLKAEAERSISAVVTEIRQARAAGRAPVACPPDRISMNPRQFLGFLNSIPAARRQRMSVTDGARAWFADRYPCQT